MVVATLAQVERSTVFKAEPHFGEPERPYTINPLVHSCTDTDLVIMHDSWRKQLDGIEVRGFSVLSHSGAGSSDQQPRAWYRRHS